VRYELFIYNVGWSVLQKVNLIHPTFKDVHQFIPPYQNSSDHVSPQGREIHKKRISRAR